MKNVLILGAGEAGRLVALEFCRHRPITDQYCIIGYLDDDETKTACEGFPVLGKLSAAPDVIGRFRIHEAIIAIPSAGKALIDRIVTLLAGTQVRIKIVPGIFEIIQGTVAFQQIRSMEPTDVLGREEVGFDEQRISSFYRDKAVFITGAGGSIGSEIVCQTLTLPVGTVTAFGRGENSIHLLIQRIGSDRRFRFRIGDVRDERKITREIQKAAPEILFHAAAHKHVTLMEESPDEAVKNNILATYRTARAAVEAGVGKFVLISTDKAVKPTSVMGASKFIAERIVLSLDAQATGTNFSVVRFGNVLGSRGSVVPIFQGQIERRRPITVTHPDITRYFMSLREAARLVLKSVEVETGRIFVLDMGQPVKILDLARTMLRLHQLSEEEVPIVFTGLRPGEKMHEELFFRSEDIVPSEYRHLNISREEHEILSELDLADMIGSFKAAADAGDGARIRALMKAYVPDFHGDPL
jgi:FlaA1/EpsC-like NDP-sugar epimerase